MSKFIPEKCIFAKKKKKKNDTEEVCLKWSFCKNLYSSGNWQKFVGLFKKDS